MTGVFGAALGAEFRRLGDEISLFDRMAEEAITKCNQKNMNQAVCWTAQRWASKYSFGEILCQTSTVFQAVVYDSMIQQAMID